MCSAVLPVHQLPLDLAVSRQHRDAVVSRQRAYARAAKACHQCSCACALVSRPSPASRTLQVSAAIVTCGGLCPGLNDVVQNIVTTLADYGVPEDQILGIRWVAGGAAGLQGQYIDISVSICIGTGMQGLAPALVHHHHSNNHSHNHHVVVHSCSHVQHTPS
jgi:hypothetical protein